jgi:predicted outer membrane repeat protein
MSLLVPNRFAFFAAMLIPGLALAATYTVTRFDDPTPTQCTVFNCSTSLREAILRANSNPGADRIVLPAGTYNLTRIDSTPLSLEAGIGALWVTESVTVLGAGSGTTRLRWSTAPHAFATPQNELFAVSQSVAVSLDIRDLSLSDARGRGCFQIAGSGVKPHHLMLRNAVVERCQTANSGGAVAMHSGNLTLHATQLLNNSAEVDGGAIRFTKHGQTNVVTSGGVLIRGNTAVGRGGAIQINGTPIPTFPEILWSDDGSMRIDGNSAGSGGAISILWGTLVLESLGAGAGNWIEINNNSAQQGGAVHIAALQPQPIASFTGVRFANNKAQNGGAISASAPIQLNDAEFTNNSAGTLASGPGDGGAIQLLSSTFQVIPSTFERVSFRDNVASGGGGAVLSGCGGFNASNVSFGGNSAAATRGQAIENRGPATLRHATVHGNLSAQSGFEPPGIQQMVDASCSSQMRIANSLVSDYCGINITRFVSDGGNQFGPNAYICRSIASDARQTNASVFALAVGNFGGPLTFWGWNANQVVPQRNFGIATNCVTRDIRGLSRSDGACDTGAFEQQ